METVNDVARRIQQQRDRERMAIISKTNPTTPPEFTSSSTTASSITLDDPYTKAQAAYPRPDKDTPMTIYPTANGYIVAPYDLFSTNQGWPVSHLMKQVYVCTTIEQAHAFLVIHWSGLAKQAKKDDSEAVASAV